MKRQSLNDFIICYLPGSRVYLGVITCEVFLCFVAIQGLGSIILTSLCSLVSAKGSYTEDEPGSNISFKHERPCLTTFPNTENRSGVFFTNFNISSQSKLKLRRKRRNKIVKNLY